MRMVTVTLTFPEAMALCYAAEQMRDDYAHWVQFGEADPGVDKSSARAALRGMKKLREACHKQMVKPLPRRLK